MHGITVEQACRFRMRNGYGICAKSQNFSDESAKHMGDEFNDIMNPLFGGQPGQSVLSCVTVEKDVFLALSTMRTEMHGRLAIFTHAYVMPAAEYGRLMQEQPEALLFVPLDQMYVSMQGSSILPAVELALNQPKPDLDNLLQKYKLDQERYAILLWAAYRSIDGTRSVCLTFSGTVNYKLNVVRELVYCVLQGMLPSLQGKISYSSSGDMRRNICLEDAQSGSIGGEAIRFAIYGDRSDCRMEDLDDLEKKFFLTLAQAYPKTRENLLQRMDAWIAELIKPDQKFSMDLVLAAYYLGENFDLDTADTGKLMAWLLNSVSMVSCNENVLDRKLSELLKKMDRITLENKNLLLRRMMVSREQEFVQEMFRLMMNASEKEKVDLLKRAMRGEYREKGDQITATLLEKLPADSKEWDLVLCSEILRWILKHQSKSTLAYAVQLVKNQTPEVCRDVIEQILCSEEQESEWTQDRNQVLETAFQTAVPKMKGEQAASAILSEDALAGWMRLANLPEQQNDLVVQGTRYYIKAYLSQPDQTGENADAVLKICHTYPVWGKVLQPMVRTEIPLVWNEMMSRIYLKPVQSRHQLIAVCKEPLTPQDLEAELPCGKQVEKQFVRFFCKNYAGSPEKELLAALKQEKRDLEQICLPCKTQRNVLEAEMCWAAEQLPEECFTDLDDMAAWEQFGKESGLKKVFELPRGKQIEALATMGRGQNTEQFCMLLRHGKASDKERIRMVEQIPELMNRLDQKGVFSWELFFLYIYDLDAKQPDSARLLDLLQKTEIRTMKYWPQNYRLSDFPVWISLEQYRTLGKEIKKIAGRGAGERVQQIMQVLLDKKASDSSFVGRSAQTDSARMPAQDPLEDEREKKGGRHASGAGKKFWWPFKGKN